MRIRPLLLVVVGTLALVATPLRAGDCAGGACPGWGDGPPLYYPGVCCIGTGHPAGLAGAVYAAGYPWPVGQAVLQYFPNAQRSGDAVRDRLRVLQAQYEAQTGDTSHSRPEAPKATLPEPRPEAPKAPPPEPRPER